MGCRSETRWVSPEVTTRVILESSRRPEASNFNQVCVMECHVFLMRSTNDPCHPSPTKQHAHHARHNMTFSVPVTSYYHEVLVCNPVLPV